MVYFRGIELFKAMTVFKNYGNIFPKLEFNAKNLHSISHEAQI